jgi:hypothetical protein
VDRGRRTFRLARALAALDGHQVRHWTSWYRWTILAMLALAFLTIAALIEHAQPPPGMIPLTRNEIARLVEALRSAGTQAGALLYDSHRAIIAY